MIYDRAIHTTTNITLIQVAFMYILNNTGYTIRHSKEFVESVTPRYTNCLLTIPEYEKTDQSNIIIMFNKFLKETPMINTIKCF